MSKVLLASQNSIKLEEVRAIIPTAEVLAVELTEIQSPSPGVVVRHKLAQVARLGLSVPVIVEDTGLAVDAWNGLPGALVKWFVEELGHQRLKEIAQPTSSPTGAPVGATATSAVGIVLGEERMVWEGHVRGRLVDGRGGLGGWTPIFEVGDTGQTLGEMTFEDRMWHTMRRRPLESAVGWLVERAYLPA